MELRPIVEAGEPFERLIDHPSWIALLRRFCGEESSYVDGITHGASARTNPGEPRVVIYRYGPSWGTMAHGYAYSQALLDRLTPERRRILQPVAPRRPAHEP